MSLLLIYSLPCSIHVTKILIYMLPSAVSANSGVCRLPWQLLCSIQCFSSMLLLIHEEYYWQTFHFLLVYNSEVRNKKEKGLCYS